MAQHVDCMFNAIRIRITFVSALSNTHSNFTKECQMKLMFINNDGGGFADYVDVEQGITVAKFFQQQLPDRNAEDYLIRVNRQPVARDGVLQDGDRVSMTPTKIEGAE